jgi:hypothetical protein
MDYDELIETWISGNVSDVAHEVSKMQPSEIIALCLEVRHLQSITNSDMEVLKILLQRNE